MKEITIWIRCFPLFVGCVLKRFQMMFADRPVAHYAKAFIVPIVYLCPIVVWMFANPLWINHVDCGFACCSKRVVIRATSGTESFAAGNWRCWANLLQRRIIILFHWFSCYLALGWKVRECRRLSGCPTGYEILKESLFQTDQIQRRFWLRFGQHQIFPIVDSLAAAQPNGAADQRRKHHGWQ